MTKLAEKVALITGAGGGIGRATCLLLAREGAKVVAADLDEAAAAETARLLREARGEAEAIQGDVTKEADVQHFVDFTVERYGRLDVLFNNAGMTIPGSVTELTEAQWDTVLDINAKGVFFGCKYGIPAMLKTAGGGSIINTGSGAGHVGTRRGAAYNAAKAAVVLLTKQVALDFARQNIRVNAVCPGMVDTAFMAKVFKSRGDVAAARKASEEAVPMGRLARPEEVAKAVLFLASDDSSYVTGSSLMVDGGYTAQ